MCHGSLLVMTSAAASSTWASADPELDAVFAEVIGTEAGRRDPYDRYRTLREHAPVYRSGMGIVICTRYEECQWVLRDSRLGKADLAEGYSLTSLEESFGERPSLLFLNPPDHTRLRSLVSKAFTPRTVERLRPKIEAMVDALLDAIVPGEVSDVMSAVAFPLPANVISAMLGVPESDWPSFRSVVSRATALLEPLVPENEAKAALAAQAELQEYFTGLVATRRTEPRDDLLSQLIAVQEGSDRLSEHELISTAILLFGAGFETTTNLIGNGLYALLTHPGELSSLRGDLFVDPSAIRPAIEELLRYDSPVQFDGRQAFVDLEIAGVRVPAGSEVVTVLGAANRDPAHFLEPDELDLHRDEGPPLSFASGIHYCLGAALARAEGQVVFSKLLERFSEMELATDQPAWKNRITLRGLSELPVVLSV
jgi:cytochrome P450